MRTKKDPMLFSELENVSLSLFQCFLHPLLSPSFIVRSAGNDSDCFKIMLASAPAAITLSVRKLMERKFYGRSSLRFFHSVPPTKTLIFHGLRRVCKNIYERVLIVMGCMSAV
jgi:hypothetical protein